ncbi:MAG: HprK-related kinase A [Rubrivivax sp.]|nr:HprK-related kinase A [Rubrivivax sp.]MBK8526449.1 HprK-related kinase A [Rubrivivax sp.]
MTATKRVIDATATAARLADISRAHVAEALKGKGLWLDLGALTLHVRSCAENLPAQLQACYPEFPFVTRSDWADVHVRLEPGRGLRRFIKPQAVFLADAREVFAPFPADSPLPLMEWGANWLIGQRTHHLLLLHAGALERDGRALVLPALPGSGKSTLTAALSHRGWRLLSDEFGAFDPMTGQFRAMLKPVALKNESIEVIRKFEPSACIGPIFPKTRKGDVAHMAASALAVRRRKEGARPGAIVLPRWEAGSPTKLQRASPETAFSSLAFNAFNYQLLGEAGFDAVLDIVRQSPAWELVYSDLDDAIKALDVEWQALPAGDWS